MPQPQVPSRPGFAGPTSPASGRGLPASGRLADNIVHFGRALRAAGLPIGPGMVLDALDALRTGGIGTKADVYWTLHAVFVKKREHTPVFDQAFRLFFRKRGYLEKLMAMMMPLAPGAPAPPPAAAALRAQDALSAGMPRRQEEERQVEIDMRMTMSDREVLRKKDFAQMTAAEIAAARAAIARMALSLDDVRTRRLAPHPHGHRIDMRRTLRGSLKAGGDFIDLKYFGPKRRPPPIVALLDISGSMSDYTRLFLHFLHAVTDARKRVHSFLFGTRLTNVTRSLARRDPDEALAACSSAVPDWSGGTRIAASLSEFNRKWARRVLGQGAIVLLITDGLERDGEEKLAFEIDRLHRSCRRLIWLNPLLRFDRFEAKAKGIRALLPHVDEFRPVHNLDSVAALCRALAGQGSDAADPKDWLKTAA
jgi:uncharacterized protein with von Willebrand factor type A (vWA) domain